MSASKYFKERLSPILNQQTAKICMKGLTVIELSSLVKYIYSGRIAIPKNNVDTLIEIAEVLELKGIIEGYKDIVSEESKSDRSIFLTESGQADGSSMISGQDVHMVEVNTQQESSIGALAPPANEIVHVQPHTSKSPISTAVSTLDQAIVQGSSGQSDYVFESDLYDKQYMDISVEPNTPSKKVQLKPTSVTSTPHSSPLRPVAKRNITMEEAQHQDLLAVAIESLSERSPAVKSQVKDKETPRTSEPDGKTEQVIEVEPAHDTMVKPSADNELEPYQNGKCNTKLLTVNSGCVSNERGGKTEMYTVCLDPSSVKGGLLMARPMKRRTEKEKKAAEAAKMYRQKRSQLINRPAVEVHEANEPLDSLVEQPDERKHSAAKMNNETKSLVDFRFASLSKERKKANKEPGCELETAVNTLVESTASLDNVIRVVTIKTEVPDDTYTEMEVQEDNDGGAENERQFSEPDDNYESDDVHSMEAKDEVDSPEIEADQTSANEDGQNIASFESSLGNCTLVNIHPVGEPRMVAHGSIVKEEILSPQSIHLENMSQLRKQSKHKRFADVIEAPIIDVVNLDDIKEVRGPRKREIRPPKKLLWPENSGSETKKRKTMCVSMNVLNQQKTYILPSGVGRANTNDQSGKHRKQFKKKSLVKIPLKRKDPVKKKTVYLPLGTDDFAVDDETNTMYVRTNRSNVNVKKQQSVSVYAEAELPSSLCPVVKLERLTDEELVNLNTTVPESNDDETVINLTDIKKMRNLASRQDSLMAKKIMKQFYKMSTTVHLNYLSELKASIISKMSSERDGETVEKADQAPVIKSQDKEHAAKDTLSVLNKVIEMNPPENKDLAAKKTVSVVIRAIPEDKEQAAEDTLSVVNNVIEKNPPENSKITVGHHVTLLPASLTGASRAVRNDDDNHLPFATFHTRAQVMYVCSVKVSIIMFIVLFLFSTGLDLIVVDFISQHFHVLLMKSHKWFSLKKDLGLFITGTSILNVSVF